MLLPKLRSTSSFLKFYFFDDYTAFFDKKQEEFVVNGKYRHHILWCRYPAKREIRR